MVNQIERHSAGSRCLISQARGSCVNTWRRGRIGIRSVGFYGGRKIGEPRENPSDQGGNQHQTQPTCQPLAQRWGASALTTMPTLLPKEHNCCRQRPLARGGKPCQLAQLKDREQHVFLGKLYAPVQGSVWYWHCSCICRLLLAGVCDEHPLVSLPNWYLYVHKVHTYILYWLSPRRAFQRQ